MTALIACCIIIAAVSLVTYVATGAGKPRGRHARDGQRRDGLRAWAARARDTWTRLRARLTPAPERGLVQAPAVTVPPSVQPAAAASPRGGRLPQLLAAPSHDGQPLPGELGQPSRHPWVTVQPPPGSPIGRHPFSDDPRVTHDISDTGTMLPVPAAIERPRPGNVVILNATTGWDTDRQCLTRLGRPDQRETGAMPEVAR